MNQKKIPTAFFILQIPLQIGKSHFLQSYFSPAPVKTHRAVRIH